ncbi:hypothetical protein Barb4_01672 [Bacteroidales bacterium Barb4]|nr:hypothetical protein Barb4_01672 [Bacteroidales bacterium Barb4]
MFYSCCAHSEEMADFSPTWSEAECGVKGGAGKEILKGRPNNIYCIVNHRLPFVLFFQNSLAGVVLLTPHSASLHVGLKSLAPSGHLHTGQI